MDITPAGQYSHGQDDTPLSIIASTVGLLTSAYLFTAGLYVFYRSFCNSHAIFSLSRERLLAYKSELDLLGKQQRMEANRWVPDGVHSYPAERRNFENKKTELLLKDLFAEFKETEEGMASLAKSFLQKYGEDRKTVSFFSYYIPPDFPYALLCFHLAFWCVLPLYTCVILILNFCVALMNLCLLFDIRWLWGKTRLMGRE